METPEPIRGMGTAHIQDTAISILYAIEFFLTSRQSQSFSGGPFMDSHWSFVYILMWLEFPMVVHLWITETLRVVHNMDGRIGRLCSVFIPL